MSNATLLQPTQRDGRPQLAIDTIGEYTASVVDHQWSQHRRYLIAFDRAGEVLAFSIAPYATPASSIEWRTGEAVVIARAILRYATLLCQTDWQSYCANHP
jgi:hypothetical protein